MSTRSPSWLNDACDRLKSRFDEPWDADEWMGDDYLLTTPTGELVTAFATNCDPRYQIQLIWLTMFATRRAIPCWKLYCDSDQPLDTVVAICNWLNTSEEQDWSAFSVPAKPTENGKPIVDCRECDTSCVADAAAQTARFIDTRNHLNAICALSAADMAFDQSPVGSVDNFRKWLIEIAIPAAYAERELRTDEQTAFQD